MILLDGLIITGSGGFANAWKRMAGTATDRGGT